VPKTDREKKKISEIEPFHDKREPFTCFVELLSINVEENNIKGIGNIFK
jgi:hypothetical protein